MVYESHFGYLRADNLLGGKELRIDSGLELGVVHNSIFRTALLDLLNGTRNKKVPGNGNSAVVVVANPHKHVGVDAGEFETVALVVTINDLVHETSKEWRVVVLALEDEGQGLERDRLQDAEDVAVRAGGLLDVLVLALLDECLDVGVKSEPVLELGLLAPVGNSF